jgi:hypothetical protein
MRRSGFRSFRPSCAKARAKSNGRRSASCRSWLATRISAAFCTPIQTCPMASIRWTPWPRRRVIEATCISESPIIRNLPITRTARSSVVRTKGQHSETQRQSCSRCTVIGGQRPQEFIVAKPAIFSVGRIFSAVRMKAGLSSFPKNVLARPRHMHALRWWPC